MKRSGKQKIKIGIVTLVLLVVIAVVGCFVYLLTAKHYQPDVTAQEAMASDSQVQISTQSDCIIFAGPDEDTQNTYGLVFYQGAMVDAQAYAPLLHQLAAQGWLCEIVDAPLDFPMLSPNAAEEIIATNSQVEHWFVGGHSLGGIVAASYAAKHAKNVEGLILLASRANTNLTQTSLSVISAYGSLDGVLNLDAYVADTLNMPSGFHELVIEGGNHAQFGSYGAQDGDTIAAISADNQVTQTVEFINQNKH